MAVVQTFSHSLPLLPFFIFRAARSTQTPAGMSYSNPLAIVVCSSRLAKASTSKEAIAGKSLAMIMDVNQTVD